MKTIISLAVVAVLAGCSDAGETGYRYAVDAAGRDGPAQRCVVCHSVDKDGPFRSAPPLWGIVGADKARFAWYGYSPALARADGVWSEAELDEYLTDPDAFLPGTRKTLTGIRDEEERKAVIAFLASLTD